MSDSDALNKSMDEEESLWVNFIDYANQITSLVPLAQQKKEEIQAKRRSNSVIPKDELDEMAPGLLAIQRSDEQKTRLALGGIPHATGFTLNVLEYTTASSTMGTAIVHMASIAPDPYPWLQEAITPFTEIAQQKATAGTLEMRLRRIDPGLGTKFEVEEVSFQRAKAGNLGIDQAAAQLRDLLQRVWGEVVQGARQVEPRKMGNRRVELGSESNRDYVAECLVRYDAQASLKLLFDSMGRAHKDLSSISKDPLYNDVGRLINLHTEVVLQLDQAAAVALLTRGLTK